jgi:hypothetical protein
MLGADHHHRRRVDQLQLHGGLRVLEDRDTEKHQDHLVPEPDRGLRFDAAKGIDIKNNNAAFDGNGHNGMRKHQFTCRGREVGLPQQRNYDIVVRPTGVSRPCEFKDPVIFNRG